jgi:hypothetical protein
MAGARIARRSDGRGKLRRTADFGHKKSPDMIRARAAV